MATFYSHVYSTSTARSRRSCIAYRLQYRQGRAITATPQLDQYQTTYLGTTRAARDGYRNVQAKIDYSRTFRQTRCQATIIYLQKAQHEHLGRAGVRAALPTASRDSPAASAFTDSANATCSGAFAATTAPRISPQASVSGFFRRSRGLSDLERTLLKESGEGQPVQDPPPYGRVGNDVISKRVCRPLPLPRPSTWDPGVTIFYHRQQLRA